MSVVMRFRTTHRKGFTLMEAMLTTIIVGVGTVAMVQLLAAGTMANADSTDQMQGITLCNNVREMMQMSSKFYFSSQTSPSHWGLEAPETKWTGDDLDDFD